MLSTGQILELGNYRLNIKEHLGGRKNLTYKVIDCADQKPLILRVIEKITEEEFLKSYTAEVEDNLRKFYQENELLKEKYSEYCREAGYEIVTAAFQGQVVLEARILKTCAHPGISNLLLFTKDAGAYYLLLDYIPGDNLQQLVEAQHQFTEEQALQWMRETAGIIHFLNSHEEDSILYNNLNPLNVVIDREQKVHLVDLESIKIYDREMGATEEWQDVLFLDSLPPFCPMEGYNGYRAEIYALGATFYYVLTGVMVPDVNERLAHDTLRPLRELKPEYSTKLEFILTLCLELDPKNRIPSAEALLKLLDASDPDVLKIEHEGSELRDLILGKGRKHYEKSFTIRIKKPLGSDVPLRLSTASTEWHSQSDSAKPVISLSPLCDKGDYSEGTLHIEANELPPGLYKGVFRISTNLGSAEFPVELEMPVKSSRMPQIAAVLLTLIAVIIILLSREMTPSTRNEAHSRWNGENWPAFLVTIPGYLLPRFSIDDTDKWEVYREVKGLVLKVARDQLIISGTPEEKVRTGWISRFFRPVGNMSVNMALENPDKGVSSAGVMVLSSSGNALAVEWSRDSVRGYRMASRTGERWDYIDAPPAAVKGGSSSAPLFRLEYNKADGNAEGFINNVKVGDMPIEFDDLGIFFFVTAEGNVRIDDLRFRILKVSFGPPVPRMPPYMQVTKGKIPIMEKDISDGKRIINTMDAERVLVREERGDWCRISTIMEGHYEGWVRRDQLRNIEPLEVKVEE